LFNELALTATRYKYFFVKNVVINTLDVGHLTHPITMFHAHELSLGSQKLIVIEIAKDQIDLSNFGNNNFQHNILSHSKKFQPTKK
jgi:hypothetical protein